MEPFKGGAWLKEVHHWEGCGSLYPHPPSSQGCFPLSGLPHHQGLALRTPSHGKRSFPGCPGPGVFHHRSREELRRYGKCPCRPSVVPKLMLVNPISTQFPCCIYTPCPPSKLCQYCHRLYFIYCVVIARQCCLHNYVLNQKSKYTEVCILFT